MSKHLFFWAVKWSGRRIRDVTSKIEQTTRKGKSHPEAKRSNVLVVVTKLKPKGRVNSGLCVFAL